MDLLLSRLHAPKWLLRLIIPYAAGLLVEELILVRKRLDAHHTRFTTLEDGLIDKAEKYLERDTAPAAPLHTDAASN